MRQREACSTAILFEIEAYVDGLKDTLPWIRDLGWPSIALYCLWKIYQDLVTKSAAREDKYAAIAEKHVQINTQMLERMEQLLVSMQNLSKNAKDEASVRQALLDKLVDTVLENRSNIEILNHSRQRGISGGES